MKIGFVVNSVATEKPQYTTTRLAMTASTMGHETWFIGLEDFADEPDGSLSANGVVNNTALGRGKLDWASDNQSTAASLVLVHRPGAEMEVVDPTKRI